MNGSREQWYSRNYHNQALGIIRSIKVQKPVIHHITNPVTVHECAAVTLSAGGSPIMADCVLEVAEVVRGADCLVINTGMPNPEREKAWLRAGREALLAGIPIVVDPVGVGATCYRRRLMERILAATRPTIIKGNRAEIRTVLGMSACTKGVDAETRGNTICMHSLDAWVRRHGCVLAVTGGEDVIAGCDSVHRVLNGSGLMKYVTGAGCMAASLIGVFAATGCDPALAATLALSIWGLAAEVAVKEYRGNHLATGETRSLRSEAMPAPGWFAVALVDSLYRIMESPHEYIQSLKIERKRNGTDGWLS